MIRNEFQYGCIVERTTNPTAIVSFQFEQINNEIEPIVVCTASVTENLSTMSSCDERGHFSFDKLENFPKLLKLRHT